MKKGFLLFALIVILVASACDLSSVGLYTADQYDVQLTRVAVRDMTINAQATQVVSAQATITSQENKITNLNVQITSLEAQAKSLQDEVQTLKDAAANNNLGSYKRMICTTTWSQMTTTSVWQISVVNGYEELSKIESDTKTSFYLTQWLPVGQSDLSKGSWVLVVDWYNGIALDGAHGCFILDPAKWSIALQ